MDIGPTGLIGQFVQPPVGEDSMSELVCATILLLSMEVPTVLALEQKPKAAITMHVLDKKVMSKDFKKHTFRFLFVHP